MGVLDPVGRLLDANETAAAYATAPVDDMVGTPFWETEWWDQDTKSLIREKVEQAAAGNYAKHETDLTDTTGERFSVTGSTRPVEDESGAVDALVVSALDVTEREVKGRRLQQQQQLVQNILDALPDVFSAFDGDGYLLRWNERFETVTGYTSKAVEDRHVTEFVPEEEVALIADQFETVISERSRVTVESAFETNSGTRIPHEFTGGSLETPDGDIRGLIGIGRDITGRKERERRFEAVFDNTYQFTGLMGPDGTVIEANQTALSFGGLDREDVVGEKLWDVYWFQVDETAREMANTAVEQARSGSLFRDQVAVQGDQRKAVIDFSLRPITDEDGTVALLIPKGRDITRLTEREQQLEVTNRVLRHNIRSRLTLIRGLADELGGADDETAAAEAGSIVEAADDLLATAQRTRKLNQLVEADPEPKQIDIVAPVVAAATAMRSVYPDAQVDLQAPDVAHTRAISTIQTAVEELIENAIVHADAERPRVDITVTAHEDTLTVAVTDTAGGLPAGEQQILTGDANVDPVGHGQGLG